MEIPENGTRFETYKATEIHLHTYVNKHSFSLLKKEINSTNTHFYDRCINVQRVNSDMENGTVVGPLLPVSVGASGILGLGCSQCI